MWKTLLLFGAGIVLVQGNCGPCPTPSLIYTELNCTGIRRSGDCCPIAYECPDLSQKDPEKCHFRGKSYEPGTDIEETGGCDAPCICRKAENEPAKWMCTHIDCPEYLGAGARLERGCKFSYKPLACCASQNEQICPENHSTLHKCSYRGIEVVKGEKFTPLDDPCYSCTCDENFKDHMYPRDQGKNCQKATCGFETAYKDKLLEGCVRVHLGESRCCGHDWICPKDLPNPQIVPTKSTSTLNGCKFGSLNVKHFEGVETNHKCRKCTCLTPPFLTCTQEPGCK